MLGLKRGTVQLAAHQPSWHEVAAEAIQKLKEILTDAAIDIQHVGSTAIYGIRAKPIIDIVVGVPSLQVMNRYIEKLAESGIIYRKQDMEGQMLFVIGDFEKDDRTHHIHVVEWNGTDWHNYINFRDYLNAFPEKAKAYDNLKGSLAETFSQDRGSYTAGKRDLILQLLREAGNWREDFQ